MNTNDIIAQIDEQISRLRQARNILSGIAFSGRTTGNGIASRDTRPPKALIGELVAEILFWGRVSLHGAHVEPAHNFPPAKKTLKLSGFRGVVATFMIGTTFKESHCANSDGIVDPNRRSILYWRAECRVTGEGCRHPLRQQEGI